MSDSERKPSASNLQGAVERFEKSLGATSTEHPELTSEWKTLRSALDEILEERSAPYVSRNLELPAILVATEKRVVGSLLGSCNALHDIPRFVALWRAGHLDLEGLITARRPLAEVNQAMDDLRAGRGIRTVLSI